MASKIQECTPQNRSRCIQIIPKRDVELLKENICILRVIINLGHVKALSKHKWPSELRSKTCILSNLSFSLKGIQWYTEHYKHSSNGRISERNTRFVTITGKYSGRLSTKAQDLLFKHLWCSNNKNAINFTQIKKKKN